MNYQECTKCVMDTSDPDITFDTNGVCNHCHQAQKSLREIEAMRPLLPELIDKIKKDGQGKKYDCLIGLSGGVDSSMVLHYAKMHGLRPLCFSVDNGWNDKSADENIMRLVEGMKVPFIRYPLDVDKFKELQSAFIQSGTANLEIPTDHVLMAITFQVAEEHGIKHILSGGNVATESIMPPAWGYNARDLVHIKDIYKTYKKKNLTGLPLCSLLKFNYYKWIRRIESHYLLDFLEYNREQSIKTLERLYGYKIYGEKHCESVFTWWFQNYYLFTKFRYDKRRAHLSSLINSGQMTRPQAMAIVLENPVYPELGIEKRVLKYKKHSYKDFKTDEKLWNRISSIIRFIRKFT